jgi:hypothetical protein
MIKKAICPNTFFYCSGHRSWQSSWKKWFSDDYHHIENPDIHSFLKALLGQLLPNINIVIATRPEPGVCELADNVRRIAAARP